MDFKNKAESLAERMNKLTEKFAENIDTAQEMVITGDDIVEYVQEKTQDIKLYSEALPVAEIINLENMISDFQYVRETLKENADNGRRVLNAVTLDLLDTDDDKRASLILSFAELNKAVADNMKLYVYSYKEISTVLLNLDKIRRAEQFDNLKTVNNTTNNLNVTTAVSTTDLIRQLAEKNK